jgi:hypothetical protein
MKSAALRFWLLAAMFAAWIGLLLYLALTTRNPVIVSRPQVLASNLDVVATVTNASKGTAVVTEVLWPEDQKGKWETKTITVTNLPACERSASDADRDKDGRTERERWTGAGEYILLLQPDGPNAFKIAAPHRSPGFDPYRYLPHIYRDTQQARDQLAEIRQPK